MTQRQPGPSDDLIEAMLAEGKYPAEIAARLGTTIAAVKARIDALQSPAPPPAPAIPQPAEVPPGEAHEGSPRATVLSLAFVAVTVLGLGYLLLRGGSDELTTTPAAFGTVRAVIESGTRVAGTGELWSAVDETPFRIRHFPGVNGIRLENGIVVLDTATGAATAWTLPPELDRASWANQLSNDLRWVVAGGPAETYAYDRKLERTLRWPQGGVRIVASFENATLFQEFHTMTGENNPQGGAFRLWRDGEPRSVRVSWPLDAPLPPFDALVEVEDQFATIAFTRLQELHVVRFDKVTGEFIGHWRAGLRSDGDVATGLHPSPSGFVVTVVPAVTIAGLGGIDLYRGEWQGAPTPVIAHHFPGARSVVPSPSGHFAVTYGDGDTDVALGVSDVPQVVIYDRAFQPVARVRSATVDDHAWFADGATLALRTSRGARVLEVKPLEFGALQLANGEVFEAETLSPSPSETGLALVDGAGVLNVDASEVHGFAVRFPHPGAAVWNRDGTEAGLVAGSALRSSGVDPAWPSPVLERPLFAVSLEAVVSDDSECSELLESPSSQANVIACVPIGTPLTVEDTPRDVRDDSRLVSSGVAFWTDEREEPRRSFVRVSTKDGGEGWMALENLAWAP